MLVFVGAIATLLQPMLKSQQKPDAVDALPDSAILPPRVPAGFPQRTDDKALHGVARDSNELSRRQIVDSDASSEPVYWLGRPFNDEAGLVGRDSDLGALDREMAAKMNAVVCGIPGGGKSRLAAEWTARSGQAGFWTEGRASVSRTFGALAPSIGIDPAGADEGALAQAVRRRIASLPENTLWVVDNVPDIELVNDLLASAGSMRLLVTTRDYRPHLLDRSTGFLLLDVLASDDAIALLRSRRADVDPSDPDLEAIARRVGGLPMALEVLAARLAAPRRSPASVKSELEEAPSAADLEAFTERATGLSIRARRRKGYSPRSRRVWTFSRPRCGKPALGSAM